MNIPKMSINSINPKLNDYFGKRFLLASCVLKSYILEKDKNIDIILNSYGSTDEIDFIIDRILTQLPDIICFSCFVWNVNIIFSICKSLKYKTKATIVVGGPGTYNIEVQKKLFYSGVHIIVLGEGEEALFNIIKYIKQSKKDFSDINNIAYLNALDNIITTEKKVLDLSKQFFPLIIDSKDDYNRFCYETSRGCYWKCSFCLWYKFESKPRFYPISKVISDLTSIFESSSINILEIVDADINMNKKRAISIYKHIQYLNKEREEKGLKRVLVQIETNPQLLSDDIINELANIDRILDFGLQTIDEKLNKCLNRPFDKEIFFKNLHTIVKKSSIFFSEHMLEIIYGLPGDNFQGFQNTIKYILDLPYKINFWCFRLLIIPGTFFSEKTDEMEIKYNINPPYEIISSKNWPELDIEKASEISFFFFLIQYCLSEIFDLVHASFNSNRFIVFEKLISNYKIKYPQLLLLKVSTGEETYQFQICKAFFSNPENQVLKVNICEFSKRLIIN